MVLKVLSIVFIACGFGLAFAAGIITDKFKLHEKAKCSFEEELTYEEVMKYKRDTAVVNTKMLGLLIALPGFILLFITY